MDGVQLLINELLVTKTSYSMRQKLGRAQIQTNGKLEKLLFQARGQTYEQQEEHV